MKSERISPFWVGGYHPFSARLSLENGNITKSIGLFDCVSYCQTKYGNTEFVPGAFFYTNRETTDEELLQDIKKAYDAKKELEEMRRLSKEINSMM